jgi:hypothetical protein
MKQAFLIFLIAVLSCTETKTDKIKSFIPGTYVKHIVNEFNKGDDTLIISGLNDNMFRINRKSTFNRIREGKVMPLVSQSETWSAMYNTEEQVLHEVQKGKVLSFLPDQNVLMVGASEYKKIKN